MSNGSPKWATDLEDVFIFLRRGYLRVSGRGACATTTAVRRRTLTSSNYQQEPCGRRKRYTSNARSVKVSPAQHVEKLYG